MSFHTPTATPVLGSEGFPVPRTPPADATPTTSKLKRLSLVAHPPRPSSSLYTSDLRSPPVFAPPFSPPLSDATPSSSRLGARLDVRLPARLDVRLPTQLGTATPRRGNSIKRSSISYSPSVAINFEQAEQKDAVPIEDGSRADSEEDVEGRDVRSQRRAWTLTDKHGDLLRLIAMRERRVNELRQELEQQEASLQALKNRWQTIVARSTPSHVMSATSSTSSLSSIDDDALGGLGDLGALGLRPGQAQAGLGAMISEVVPEAIQEGKKFWGQLMRTVGAAASGSVPDEEGGLDLSGLRSVIPIPSFSLTSAPSHAPVRLSRPEPVRLRPVSSPPLSAPTAQTMPASRVRRGEATRSPEDSRQSADSVRGARSDSASPSVALAQELQEMDEEGDEWGW
ncbi:hypothetical protein Q5752_005988 [Cryptotrichosporon argae]